METKEKQIEGKDSEGSRQSRWATLLNLVAIANEHGYDMGLSGSSYTNPYDSNK